MAQERLFHITEKALRRCGRGSSAKRNIITGRAEKRYYAVCKHIMQYPEKYVPKHGKPHIRKPEEFQAVQTTCFLTSKDGFSSSEQLPDGASHSMARHHYKMESKPLCFIVNILSLHKSSCTRETKSKLSFHSFALTLHKSSCTRETKSKLSLHSFALTLHKSSCGSAVSSTVKLRFPDLLLHSPCIIFVRYITHCDRIPDARQPDAAHESPKNKYS